MSAPRDAQVKDSWRLRPADLNDIDGLHALAANPLVCRYLFDGVPPNLGEASAFWEHHQNEKHGLPKVRAVRDQCRSRIPSYYEAMR